MSRQSERDRLSASLLVLAVLLWALAWLNPNHFRPWMSFWNELPALLAVWALALMLALRSFGRATLGIPRIAALIALIGAGLPTLQMVGGLIVFAGDLLIYVAYGLTAACAVWVGYSAATQLAHATVASKPVHHVRSWRPSHDWPDWRAHWVWLPAVVAALVGVLQWLGLAQAFLGTAEFVGFPGARAMGPLGHTSQMSVVCVLGLVALWYERSRGGLQLGSYTVMSCLLGLVLVLTQARIGLWALVAVAVYITLFVLRRPVWMPTGARAQLMSAWGLVGGVFVLRACLPYVHEWMLVAEPRSTGIANPNERHKLWHQMLEGAWQSPWWGWGWNNSSAAQAAASDRYDTNGYSDYAHNMLIDLIAWTGAPIGIILCGLVIAWTVTRFRKVSSFDGFASNCGLVVLFLYALTEFPFAYGYFLVLGGLLVGAVEAAYPRCVTFRWAPSATSVALVAVVVAVLSGAVVRDYVRMEQDFGELRLKMFGVGEVPADREPPPVLVLTQLYALQAVLWRPISRQWTAEEVDQLERVSKRSSYLQVRATAALIFQLQGRTNEAAVQVTIMRKRYGQGALRWYEGWLERYEALSPAVSELRRVVRTEMRN